jgi:hypothetical protein
MGTHSVELGSKSKVNRQLVSVFGYTQSHECVCFNGGAVACIVELGTDMRCQIQAPATLLPEK